MEYEQLVQVLLYLIRKELSPGVSPTFRPVSESETCPVGQDAPMFVHAWACLDMLCQTTVARDSTNSRHKVANMEDIYRTLTTNCGTSNDRVLPRKTHQSGSQMWGEPCKYEFWVNPGAMLKQVSDLELPEQSSFTGRGSNEVCNFLFWDGPLPL